MNILFLEYFIPLISQEFNEEGLLLQSTGTGDSFQKYVIYYPDNP